MGRPRKYKESESSLLIRADPSFITMVDDMIDSGFVNSRPEATRRIAEELNTTKLKKFVKFPGFFK